MNVRFETCERIRGLRFLRIFYPDKNLEDTGKTKAVLDMVKADIIRIPDPKYHPGGRVYPGKNWENSKKEEYMKVLNDWQQSL